MPVSVYVYVTLTWHCWLPFSTLPYSCIPLQIVKRTVFFFLISLCGTLDSSYYYQHTQASGLLFLPCNHCGVREMCILEERPVFL
jgi:hypothetical protein